MKYECAGCRMVYPTYLAAALCSCNPSIIIRWDEEIRPCKNHPGGIFTEKDEIHGTYCIACGEYIEEE